MKDGMGVGNSCTFTINHSISILNRTYITIYDLYFQTITLFFFIITTKIKIFYNNKDLKMSDSNPNTYD